MSERNWTDGPWMAGKRSSVVGLPVVAPHASGQLVCNVIANDDDAHLIAAAPELFESVFELMEQLSYLNKENGKQMVDPSAEKQARAALAKAKGEQV